jgi:integrase
MTTPTHTGRTTMEIIESFWRMHWASYAPGSRSNRHGRLVVMAASLLDDPAMARRILVHLRQQNVKHRCIRPEAKSREAWAARYLLDQFLPAPGHASGATVDCSPELAKAACWLRSHSSPVNDITGEDLVQLRSDLGGRTYYTVRSYWAQIETVLHWALLRGFLERDPTIGLPKIVRKLDGERVDPDRVPNEEEVWGLARAGVELEGEWFKVAVLLGTFGAMRPGEVIALRRRHLRSSPDGGLWLRIESQRRRYSKRHSDDGRTSFDFAPPKGRPVASGGTRRCYIPSRVAWEIAEYVDGRFGDDLLFVNGAGDPLSTDGLRTAWRRVIDSEPVGPRLAGITPHVMRRAGMSIWLRQGLDLKLIQRWGGWHSLVVMLDTYAALLPGAEEDSIALLEGRRSSNRRRRSSQALPKLGKSVSSKQPSSRRDGAIGG